MDHDGKPVERKPHHVAWDPIMAEKAATSTNMQKEIFRTAARRSRHFLGRISQTAEKSISAKWASPSSNFRDFTNVRIVACGTSWHAALAGKFMIERLARLPVEVDTAANSLSRSDSGCENFDGVHQPVGRERPTPLRAARSETKTFAHARDLQCSWLDDYPRSCLETILTHAGPEIWRCFNKSIYRAAHRTGLACRVSWGSSRSVIRQRGKKSFAEFITIRTRLKPFCKPIAPDSTNISRDNFSLFRFSLSRTRHSLSKSRSKARSAVLHFAGGIASRWM